MSLTDYRMDACYSFRIRAGEETLLVGSHPVQADVLFISPYQPAALLQKTLRTVRPHRVVLIHWDDFFRPLNQPLRPMIATWAQGLRGWPPVRKLDVGAVARRINEILPGVEVTVPELMREYDV